MNGTKLHRVRCQLRDCTYFSNQLVLTYIFLVMPRSLISRANDDFSIILKHNFKINERFLPDLSMKIKRFYFGDEEVSMRTAPDMVDVNLYYVYLLYLITGNDVQGVSIKLREFGFCVTCGNSATKIYANKFSISQAIPIPLTTSTAQMCQPWSLTDPSC